MIIYKVNEMFWDLNEKSGCRKVRVICNDECIAIFNSTFSKSNSSWECVMVPMGLSFNKNQVYALKNIIQNSEKIMDILCSTTLSFDEVQSFLLTEIQNNV